MEWFGRAYDNNGLQIKGQDTGFRMGLVLVGRLGTGVSIDRIEQFMGSHEACNNEQMKIVLINLNLEALIRHV